MKYLFLFLLSIACIGSEAEDTDVIKVSTKTKDKVFGRGIFNVIQFPNTGCPGGSGRNGTCYTTSECNTKGGTADGSCANGYGVCCIIKLACGQMSSENCTYLTLSGTSPPQSCLFSLCKCNQNICRIRLDFTAFDITGPFAGTTVAAVTTTNYIGNSIGDCTSDSFTVQTPGNVGTPVICGYNTGQHVYVDASDVCTKASFNFGPNSYNRQIDIKVTQFTCGDEKAGPSDCLQYFTSETGVVKSFNYKVPSNGAVEGTATHLSSQLYSMCFRRGSGKCAICFSPTINLPTASISITTQNSFGLSISDTTAGTLAKSATDTLCTSDYILIPSGVESGTAKLTDGVTNRGRDRFCGRFLTTINAVTTSATVCSARRPFRITFRTDADEATLNALAAANVPAGGFTTTELDETIGAPGGIIGFSLDYFQIGC